MRKYLFFVFIAVVSTALHAQKVKVACVGNSVTYGYTIPDRETNAYPVQLQKLLGTGYEVRNFGKSGATLLTRGHRPYVLQEEYEAALAFRADVVVIHLGLNDTDPRNWPNYGSDFVRDYTALIRSFKAANRDCRIWICRMTPIFNSHPRFKSGTRDWYWKIQKSIEDVAAYNHVGLIDLQEELYARPDLFADALHPNAEGAGVIARKVYRALTGDFGGLRMPPVYSDNMVLQRDRPLVITGMADRGEEVRVSLNGQKARTSGGINGKWQVALPAMQAGGPYTLKIETKKKSLMYKNVLVGDVWLCSGQSNMAFQVRQSSTGKETIGTTREKCTSGLLRFFDMKPRWETYSVEWNDTVLDSLNRLQYYKPTRWAECTPETVSVMSAVAYYFGEMLADSIRVPIGLIHNAVGGSPTEAWIRRKTLEFEFPDILYDWKRNDMIQAWVRDRATLNVKRSVNKLQRHPYEPCYLYEAGIEPLCAFPVKGVIWYQGESNAHNMEIHEILFPLLVKSWRENWGEELPFYYVQLSGMNRPAWPAFRDSQRRMLTTVPGTGMVVCSDRGDSLDVHPVYKKEVGERLARWALNCTYDRKLLPSGPLFRAAEYMEGAVYLTFDFGEGLRAADNGELLTFEVAEVDGLYFPAKATIVENRIKLDVEKKFRPRYVRYGWQPFTRANLVNQDGLPASTFKAVVPD